MKVYIFVEGTDEAELLRRLIPTELANSVVVVSAASSASIPSLARSVLATRRQPVVVVLDSESLSSDLIRDRRQSLKELIQAAAPSVPAKVVVAVPQFEALFFHAPHLLPKLLGYSLAPEVVARARYEPAAVLEELLPPNSGIPVVVQLVNAMTPQDMETLKSTPFIRELNEILHGILKSSPSEKQTTTV